MNTAGRSLQSSLTGHLLLLQDQSVSGIPVQGFEALPREASTQEVHQHVS